MKGDDHFQHAAFCRWKHGVQIELPNTVASGSDQQRYQPVHMQHATTDRSLAGSVMSEWRLGLTIQVLVVLSRLCKRSLRIDL